MSKPTPGPWVVLSVEPWGSAQVGNETHSVAFVIAPTIDERNANAHLIAAAPKMHAAIQEAFENCELCRDLGPYDVSRCVRCRTFREIIDQVEG